ncbi:MAG TPA: chloride channel protein [Acidobacteriaceae bacterium]|nr:chloride channel protein [Acidobacteriaceae bacterium]
MADEHVDKQPESERGPEVLGVRPETDEQAAESGAAVRAQQHLLKFWHGVELRRVVDALVLGVVGGLAAQLFEWMLRVCAHLFLYDIAGYMGPEIGNFGTLHAEVIGRHGLWLIPVVTTLGGLISGLLVFTFAPEAEGHGTDTVVHAFHQLRGKIRARVAPLKMVASAITIGSGGSAGREGPTALITAGFGSIYANLLKRTDQERRFLIIVGMAAGLSAVFRSPLGTAIFAIEVLYSAMEFESRLLIYTMLASVVAYAVNGIFVGLHPLFSVPAAMLEPSYHRYPWYALLGIAGGVVGTVLPEFFYKVRDLFHRIPCPSIFKPAIGGLVVGLIALEWPQVLGGGYGWMQMAILGKLTLGVLAALLGLKIVALAFTVGSGGSGGVFAPSLFVGAMLGGLVAAVFHQPPAPFVIVGMAALFAAAARVPVATLLMVVEMTGGYQLLVPAGLAVALAFLAQNWLSQGLKYRSLYEAQVPTPAQSPAHYVEELNAAFELIRAHQFKQPSLVHGLDMAALMQSGIPVTVSAGEQIFMSRVQKGSALAGQTIAQVCGEYGTDALKALAIFRGDEVLLPHDSSRLEAEDRVLLVSSAETKGMLEGKLGN